MVRLVVGGKTQSAAYASVFPAANSNTAGVKGAKPAHRTLVSHTVTLGRAERSVQTAEGIKYDLAAAMRDIDAKIAKAEKLEQMSAVANLIATKMTISGIWVDRIDQRAVEPFEIKISGIYPEPEPVRVIEPEGDPRPPE